MSNTTVMTSRGMLVSIAAAIAGLAALITPTAAHAAPPSAGMTSAQYEALQVGQTRHHVQTTIDDRGCRLVTAVHAGKVYIRKLYKAQGTGDAWWVTITYVKATPDTPFRLAAANVVDDLQLLGETCSS